VIGLLFERAYLRFVRFLNAKSTSAAVRLTKWTGKSRIRIHPKHLIAEEDQHRWYVDRIQRGMVVLDVGCGNGVHSITAASRGAVVIGLDYDLPGLRKGQALCAEKRAMRVSFLRASAEQTLPFVDGRFDLVLLLDVLEHVHRRVELLREIHRALRPHGALMLSAPNRNTTWKRRLRAAVLSYYADPDHKVEYSRRELLAELQEGGFFVEGELMPVVYDTAWAGLIDLVGGVSLWAYQRLSRLKRQAAHRHPQETTGWRVICKRMDRLPTGAIDEHRPH